LKYNAKYEVKGEKVAKDINKKKYSEETQLKLDIFAEFFREWFPVFINNIHIEKIYILDLFAGSGSDIEDNLGSPLKLLQKAKGENRMHCSKINKQITFIFNELKKTKLEELKKNVNEYISKCKAENNCGDICIYENNIKYFNDDFLDFFNISRLTDVLKNKKYAKFFLLDQYGFKLINKDIFLKLVESPKTDFIFFISSSYIKRFKDIDAVKNHIDTSKFTDDEKGFKESHREIAKYYKNFISDYREYYLHHFTIKKGANYYGLIFGTNHTLGMEKFLKVCWKHDKLAGESNCNINNDNEEYSLFFDENSTAKKNQIREDIRNKIISSEIKDNISGLKYTIKKGGLAELYIEVIEELKKSNKVNIIGKFNRQASNIHNAKLYNIEVIK